MKLALVTPWASPFIWTKFCKNLAGLLTHFHRPGWEVEVFFGRGCDPAARHVSCCNQALEWGADLICIIGADQVHPLNMLDTLLDDYEDTGGQVIGALVPFRGYVPGQGMKPFQPMGWRMRTKGTDIAVGKLGESAAWEPIDPAAGELQRADIIGSGVLLFHVDFLKSLKKPWFYYGVNEDMQRIADMDTRFVWRLRSEAQAEVWVDTTIKIKHLHAFEIDDTFQDRFADWAEPGVSDEDIIKHLPQGAEV